MTSEREAGGAPSGAASAGLRSGAGDTPAEAPARLAVIGGGKMGGPFATRVIETGLLPPERVTVSEPVAAARERLTSRLGVTAVADNRAAVQGASTVLLAVTPQVIPAVLAGLRGALSADVLVLSIAAGVTLETLQEGLAHAAVVRVMPNTPAQVGQGIAAWFASETVTPQQKANTRAVLRSVGREFEVDRERYLDMVTAVSASGPAWVMLVAEAMIDAGVQIGLPPDWSRELVYQTFSGSIELARQTGLHPAELRNRVTTPGGTTAAGLYAMERAAVRGGIGAGIVAAYERAVALGEAARAR